MTKDCIWTNQYLAGIQYENLRNKTMWKGLMNYNNHCVHLPGIWFLNNGSISRTNFLIVKYQAEELGSHEWPIGLIMCMVRILYIPLGDVKEPSILVAAGIHEWNNV